MRTLPKLFLIAAVLFCSSAHASVNQICEQDGSPCGFPWKLIVDSGSVTDNADGTFSLTTSVAGYISDTAYDATTWNGVTTIAPSKNAVRDELESLKGLVNWDTDANVVHLTTTTDNVSIGTTAGAGKLFLDGDADEIQLQVQANGTQTANPIVYENSTGTDLWWVTADGGTASAPSSTSAGWLDLYEDSDDGSNKIRLIAQAMAADVTLTLPATDGDAGQYLQTDGSGGLSWQPGGSVSADSLDFTEFADAMTLDAATSISTGAYTMTFACNNPGSGCFDINGTGAFTGDLLHVHQHTGNAGAGNLIHAEAVDMDVNPLIHIEQSAADITSDVVGLLISVADDDDANYIPLEIRDDSGVANDLLFKIDYTGTVTTGIWNAGNVTSANIVGSTSLQLPNGASPTVDAAGEIAVDTTNDQLIYYGGAKRVQPYIWSSCKTIESPADADDNVILWSFPYAVTVVSQWCMVQGGTSIAWTLSDGTNSAEAITCDADGQADDGSMTNNTFTTHERMESDHGAPSGSVTWVMECIEYTVDAT